MLPGINVVMGANTAQFTKNIQKATKQAEQNIESFSSRVESVTKRFANLGTLLGGVSVAGLVQVADQMQAIASKVRLATQSSEEYKAVSQQLRDIANSQRASFEGVVDLYSSSQRALSALGKSQQDVIGFTRNFTTAMNVAGASSEAQKAVLLQLGQALNMGVLRGAEFNSVASQTPIVMELIAKKMGVAIGELKDLAAKGQITAEVIFDAVSGATDELTEKAAKMPATVTAALQVVKDNVGYVIHDIFNETTGVMSRIADAIAWFGTNLSSIIPIASAVGAVFAVQMARSWLVAKLGVDSLTGSMLANIRTSIANATSTQRLGNVLMAWASGTTNAQMAMHRYSLAINQATASVMGFVRAIPAKTAALGTATTAVLAKTRATLSLAAAHRALIATSVTAARGVMGIGTAFAALGRIIMAHPIMTIAAIIAAIIVRTMGLQKAMQSLSDAVSVLGELIGMMIDGAVAGFKWLGSAIDRFFARFNAQGKQSTGIVSKYFGWLFEGTAGGFVGLLQVIARILDQVVGFFYAATRAIYRNMVGLWNSLKQGFADAFNSVSKTVESSINAVLDTYDKVIGKVNGLIRDAKAAASVVGLDGLVPNERADTGGYRVKAITIQPTKTQAPSGDFASDRANFRFFEDKVNTAFATVNNKKAQQAQEQAAQAAKMAGTELDKMAGATAKNKGATDKETAAKQKQTDAQKRQTQATDKATEAFEKLREAFNTKMQEWQKTIWENENVKAGLESERFLYELRENEKSEFYGLEKSNPQMADNLKAQALQADKSNAFAEVDNIIESLNNEYKQPVSKFSEVLNGIFDERNKLSAIAIAEGIDPANLDAFLTSQTTEGRGKTADGSVDLGGETIFINNFDRLQKIRNGIAKMMELADAQVNNLTAGYEKANAEILDQLELQLAGGDVARELLTIERDKKRAINAQLEMIGEIGKIDQDKANQLKDQIKASAEQNAQIRTKLFLTQQYQAIENDLTSEHDKQLKTLKEQFAVIASLAALQRNGDDDLSGLPAVNTTALLDKSLGLQDEQTGFAAELDKINSQYAQRQAIINAWEAEMRAKAGKNQEELNRITLEGEQRRTEIKRQFQITQANLGLAAGNEMVGQMADFAKTAYGEQSKHYRAMFALQKGFAIATASLALYENVSKAMKLGFPANIGAIAAATMQGVKILSLIRQIQSPIVGQAHDGIMSVPKSGTWNLEKGERVLPKHTAKAMDKQLANASKGGKGVVINNYTGQAVETKQTDDGLMITIGKMVGDAIDYKLAERDSRAKRQGWGY